MNELRLTKDREALLREQLQRLLRNAWFPHFVLVMCGLFGMALFEYELERDSQVAVLVATGALAGMHWLMLRAYHNYGTDMLRYGVWKVLQLAGALMTGIVTAALMVILLPVVGDWQQMLLLAMLISMLVSFWLASVGCMLSFVSYVTPIVIGAVQVLASASSPELQNLAIFLVGLILVELLTGFRVSTLYTNKLMLKQLLLRTREEQSESMKQLERELAQLRTREQSLQLQLGSMQAHLEHNSSEQTQSLKQTFEKLRTSEERLQQALDASGLALWDWDLVTGRIYHTGSDKLLGVDAVDADQLLADLRPLMHPDDLPVLRTAMLSHLRQETEGYRVEYRIRHADGHWVWIEDSGKAISRDGHGRVLRMLGTRRDISGRRQHEEELKLASIVFDTGSEAIMVMDGALQVLTTNQAFTRITGYERENAKAFKERLHRSLVASGPGSARQVLLEQGAWHAELTGVRSSGSTFPLRLRLHAVYAPDGIGLTHVVAFFTDMTQFREAQQRLDYLARHDELTGLSNRNLFHQKLQEVSCYAHSVDTGLALLHIDLDRFKLLNECFGTETGDEILRIVGRRLQRFSSPQRSLARLGGNEFVMVVSGLDEQGELGPLAEDVLAALRAPFVTAGEELLLSASIGISWVLGEEMDAHMLLNRAAVALGHAKYLGGNTWQLYRDEMSADGGERLQLEQQLRRGLKEGHVQAHYQPKLCLKENRIYAVEALARWYHPVRGMISPVQFIPLAEETGLIGELSETILRQACNQAKRWLDEGAPLQVSVNLSVQHLRQGNVLELVRTVLDDSRLPARLLELELTESQLLDDSERLLATIADLRAMGVQIAVDDFGTGYSSLGYLKQLPANSLKIDRSFIGDLSSGSKDAAIIRAIIVMAHGLSLEVVAEGIETGEQLEALQAMGCDAVQGYLIARPGPAAELQSLLQVENPIAWVLESCTA